MQHFNLKHLQSHLIKDTAEYASIGVSIPNKDGLLQFVDNGSKILAVAHLDTVRIKDHVKVIHDRVITHALDDRLGVYTVLDLLPAMGIVTDILLTDCEEFCRSTGWYFDPPKQYNWIVEFDRGGDNSVVYHYEDVKWKKALQKFTHLGIGSYSDICDIDANCCAVNWAVAYHNAHTNSCHMFISDYLSQMRKFELFYREYHNKYFKFDADAMPKPAVSQKYNVLNDADQWSFADYSAVDWDSGIVGYCDLCSGEVYKNTPSEETFHMYGLCEDCYIAQDESFQ